MASLYEVSRGGKVHGPYPTAELKRLAATGTLRRDDLVRKQGTEVWNPATDSFNFTLSDGTTTVQQAFGIALTGAATVCEPRSPVRLRTRVIESGRMEATITATGLDVPLSNRLRAIRVGNAGPWRVERSQLEVWIEEQYEQTRRYSSWNQGEFANVAELSGVRTGRIRPVD